MPQGKPPGFGHEDAARCYSEPVQHLERISINPDVMGGKPCIRGMRVTVGMIVEALAAGRSVGDLLADFPYLEERDIRKAPAYASGLAQGRNLRSPADAAALGHEPDRHVGSAVT